MERMHRYFFAVQGRIHLKRRLASFAGTNPNRIQHFAHKNLAVADLSGLCSLDNQGQCVLQPVIRDDHFDADLR